MSVKGYKATKFNMMCRFVKFELGKTYKNEGVVSPCFNGFHFCENLEDVFDYYPENNCMIFEVIGSGNIVKHGNKTVCSEIKFIRHIDMNDVRKIKRNKSATNACIDIINRIDYFNMLIDNHDTLEEMINNFQNDTKKDTELFKFISYLCGKNLYISDIIESTHDVINHIKRDLYNYNMEILPCLITFGYTPTKINGGSENLYKTIVNEKRTDLYPYVFERISRNDYINQDFSLLAEMIKSGVIDKDTLDTIKLYHMLQSGLISYALAYRGFYIDEMISLYGNGIVIIPDEALIEILKHKFVWKFIYRTLIKSDGHIKKECVKVFLNKIKCKIMGK